MPFPATRDEMEERGYSLNECDGTICKTCRTSIEFWNTPSGNLIPMDPMHEPESKATPHWATCPDANNFRKKK